MSSVALVGGLSVGAANLTNVEAWLSSERASVPDDVDFVPPAPSDRIGIAYRTAGDNSFSNVEVATVEPFGSGAPADDDSGIETSWLTDTAPKAEGHSMVEHAAESRAASDDDAASSDRASVMTASTGAGSASGQWPSDFSFDSSLVGSIARPDGSNAGADALTGTAAGARYLLLGEMHDGSDSGRTRADVIGGLAKLAKRHSAAFETSQSGFADTIEGWGHVRDRDVAEFGERQRGSEDDWPDFAVSRSVFQAADGDLPVVDDSGPGPIGAGGRDAAGGFDLDAPLSAQETAAMADEIRTARCDAVPGAVAGHSAKASQVRAFAVQMAEDDTGGKWVWRDASAGDPIAFVFTPGAGAANPCAHSRERAGSAGSARRR